MTPFQKLLKLLAAFCICMQVKANQIAKWIQNNSYRLLKTNTYSTKSSTAVSLRLTLFSLFMTVQAAFSWQYFFPQPYAFKYRITRRSLTLFWKLALQSRTSWGRTKKEEDSISIQQTIQKIKSLLRRKHYLHELP